MALQPDAERPGYLRCRSCGAPIFYGVNSATGARIILDAEPVAALENGHYAIDWPSTPYTPPRALHRPAIHLTHFATCPNAASHRKPRSAA